MTGMASIGQCLECICSRLTTIEEKIDNIKVECEVDFTEVLDKLDDCICKCNEEDNIVEDGK